MANFIVFRGELFRRPINQTIRIMSTVKKPSAGIIIIGDEILKGQTQDTNTHFLAQNLKSNGIQLKRVVVIPDEIQTIADEVKTFSDKFDFVLTSGGVGPTHDDVTYEGVAKAFEDSTFLHPELEAFIRGYFKDVNDATLKLGQIPKSSVLNYPSVLKPGQVRYPLISVKNVYIFPGIPILLQKAFERMKDDLFKSDYKSHVTEVYTELSEVKFAAELNVLVEKYPQVTFGSYPKWTHNYYSTKVTIEAESTELVEQVAKELRMEVPTCIDFDPEPFDNSMEKIEKLLGKARPDGFGPINERFVANVSSAFKTLRRCFAPSDLSMSNVAPFKPDEVSVAFNGGKDNVAMVHLTMAYLKKHFPDYKSKIPALYIKDPDPFPEIEEFIQESVKNYNLELVVIEASMKEALSQFLAARPKIKAMIMGTRDSDPNCNGQGPFAPTDGDWPKLMRINPVLFWHYQDVWTFIRSLSVPYPDLYDKGYTSLGGQNNTKPNPHLAYTDENGKPAYKPAYKLTNGDLERAGRQCGSCDSKL